jgi:hypothetical protein
MTLQIRVMTWEKHRNAAVLNRLMGPQASPLDNWISIGNINKRKKNVQIRFTQDNHILSKTE